jgi:hypothetical protein
MDALKAEMDAAVAKRLKELTERNTAPEQHLRLAALYSVMAEESQRTVDELSKLMDEKSKLFDTTLAAERVTRVGVSLSEAQAEKTIDGWLKNAGFTPSASKRGMPASKDSTSAG